MNAKLVDGVFSAEEKHRMAEALTEVMVRFEGSEAFREVAWVLIESCTPTVGTLAAAHLLGRLPYGNARPIESRIRVHRR